jgi:hypothetical protein
MSTMPAHCQTVGVNWARSCRRPASSGSSVGPIGMAGPSQHARCGSINGAQHVQPHACSFFRAASQGARKVPPCLRPLVSAARRSNRPSHLGRCKPPRESGAGLFRNRLGLRGCRRRGSIEALDVAASVANTRRQGGYLALIGPAPTPFRPHKLAAPALKEWRGERRAESGGGESFRCTKESDAGHVVKGGGPWETSSTPPSPCNNPKSTAPPDWLALALPVPVNWV